MAAGEEVLALEAPALAEGAPAVDEAAPAVAEEAPAAAAAEDDGQAAAAAPAVAVKTFRNHDGVLKNGYVYTVRRRYKDTVYWRCAQTNKLGCRATAKSADGSIDIVPAGVHNHDPEEAEVKAKQITLAARDQAVRQRTQASSAIVDDLLYGIDDDVALVLKRENLLRVANRAKRTDGSQMLNRPVGNIQWPPAFTFTASGMRFKLYDSRDLEPDLPIFFIFSSPVQLAQLREHRHWSADGTFWCVPPQFSQLYTLHVNIGHSTVPVAYMLLQNFDKDTYVRALRALIMAGQLEGIRPESIMMDMELAAIQAFLEVFPDVVIRLCLFHFAQALWRAIQERGLVALYKEVEKAREILRCFGSLATLPAGDVIQGLNAIVDELRRMLYGTGEIPMEYEAALIGFEDYFEKTYVRRLDNWGRAFVDPRFKVIWWNCHEAILAGLFRTNNAVEGWHLAFNRMFPAAHMALDKFIMRLQTDEDKARQMILRNEYYQADPVRHRRRPKYMASDKHMLAVARRYNNHYQPTGQVLRYLRCMQFHLCKARFEAGDEDDPLEEVDEHEAGNDDDPDGVPVDPEADGDAIPHNESHPSVDEADIQAALDELRGNDGPVPVGAALRQNEAGDDGGPAGQREIREHQAQPPAQEAVRADAHPAMQPHAIQAVQSQNGDMLPGGSQLGPASDVNAANGNVQRQTKRTAALSASAAWSFGRPSISRPRFT